MSLAALDIEEDLSDSVFRRFAGLVYAASGIHLTKQKKELLRARLRKRLRALGITSYKEYFHIVSAQGAEGELRDLLDVVSTNKTEFFREARHFEHLVESAIPQWLAASGAARGPLRIWSAACSSGEEVYTLAMVLSEALAGRADFKILGTDISTRMLDRALAGVFEERHVEAVPAVTRGKYFVRAGHDERRGSALWTVKPELRAKVAFARLNLIEGEFPFQSPWDIIFCRNVMIYFDRTTQQDLVARMSKVLAVEGWLYTGMSESLLAIQHGLKTVAPSIYRKPA